MNPMVTFTPTVAGSRAVTVLLGTAAAVASAGGGWAAVSRPKRVGFTVWEGYDPYTLELSVMFDGFASQASQEEEYDALRRIMRTPVGPTSQPSPVMLSGPVPLTNLPWVIQSITQDPTSVIRSEANGSLLRVAATVSLLEYVEADVLIATVPSPAARVNEVTAAGAVPAGRTHILKKGDTLWGIAQKYLGAGKRYTEIVTLNGIKNPNRVKVGTVLKIP